MENQEIDKLISIPVASKMMQLSAPTIRAMCLDGRMPHVFTPGGQIRLRTSDVEAYCNEHRLLKTKLEIPEKEKEEGQKEENDSAKQDSGNSGLLTWMTVGQLAVLAGIPEYEMNMILKEGLFDMQVPPRFESGGTVLYHQPSLAPLLAAIRFEHARSRVESRLRAQGVGIRIRHNKPLQFVPLDERAWLSDYIVHHSLPGTDLSQEEVAKAREEYHSSIADTVTKEDVGLLASPPMINAISSYYNQRTLGQSPHDAIQLVKSSLMLED